MTQRMTATRWKGKGQNINKTKHLVELKTDAKNASYTLNGDAKDEMKYRGQ